MFVSVPILPGVRMAAVQTDKFKTGCFSVNLLRPLCREEAALNALLPSVLLRGTREQPTMRKISEWLDSLYGASAGSFVRKRGEVQTVGFYADFLEHGKVHVMINHAFVGKVVTYICHDALSPSSYPQIDITRSTCERFIVEHTHTLSLEHYCWNPIAFKPLTDLNSSPIETAR